MAEFIISVFDFSTFAIFFFKQKTAYEMRISDWSSDVCSSDLPDIACELLGDFAQRLAIHQHVAEYTEMSHMQAGARLQRQRRIVAMRDRQIEHRDPFRQRNFLVATAGIELSDARRPVQQAIGKASGGERVCKYVYITVVAGSIK